MTEIRFYHLERQSLDRALPALLEKARQKDHKIVIKVPDESERERLNAHLWTYDAAGFLPHGSEKDGYADRQPVYLTAKEENPNGADVLILTGGADSQKQAEFTLCCEMLDGRDAEAVKAARRRWKTYKEQEFDVTYWHQGAQGWEMKSD